MVAISTVVIFASLCVLAMCGTTPPRLVTMSGCYHDGHKYHIGESFQPSPCEHCYCTPSGSAACAIADCFFTPCVDAIHDPKKCCPVCPNGHNCRHTDGTIIKAGDTYHPDPDTSCSCPNSFHFGQQTAICAHRIVDPAPVVITDPIHTGK